ncbi:hypothetical protein KBY97_14260 [Synechococcus sp. ATX 2A4]|uniref:hypothetical protein n=1 Tax=Synechococcus sp. ATX 2A4 TaxID=2823727 RepID=UPI0020CE5B9F|nr:hypothetical protein [Synechococcus sp. ATX 2A4]MCP9886275.1 hypothetical protein [Synechococcus sp. ATX 2A4]
MLRHITGGPLLRHEAHAPDGVEEQLEADVNRFINNAAEVRCDLDASDFSCSKIFQW